MTPAPHLHLAHDAATGEVIDGCANCIQLEEENEGLKTALSASKGQNTRLKRQLANMRFVAPDTDDVRELLDYHRKLLMPGVKIAESSVRWGVVSDLLKLKDAETDKPLFSVLELKAAIAGMALQPYIMDAAHLYRRDLTTAFCSRRNGGPSLPDPGKVERHIGEAIGFRRETGTSALELLDDLADERLAWLADRCSCGEMRVAHLMCRTACEDFDEFEAKQWRWLRQQDGRMMAS